MYGCIPRMHSFRTLVNVITPDTYTVRGVTLTAQNCGTPTISCFWRKSYPIRSDFRQNRQKYGPIGTRRDQNFVQIAKTNARLDPICWPDGSSRKPNDTPPPGLKLAGVANNVYVYIVTIYLVRKCPFMSLFNWKLNRTGKAQPTMRRVYHWHHGGFII